MDCFPLNDIKSFRKEVEKIGLVCSIAKNDEFIIIREQETILERLLDTTWVGQVLLSKETKKYYFYLNSFNVFKNFDDLVRFIDILRKYAAKPDGVKR